MSFFEGIANLFKDIDWGGVIKTVAPLAINAYANYEKENSMKDYNKAALQNYNSYLGAINPPKQILDQRFAGATELINRTGVDRIRRVGNETAARGERGRGPLSNIDKATALMANAKNDARHQIYDNYNVPSAPGPIMWNGPTAMARNANDASQYVNYMAPRWWDNQYGNANTGTG